MRFANRNVFEFVNQRINHWWFGLRRNFWNSFLGWLFPVDNWISLLETFFKITSSSESLLESSSDAIFLESIEFISKIQGILFFLEQKFLILKFSHLVPFNHLANIEATQNFIWLIVTHVCTIKNNEFLNTLDNINYIFNTHAGVLSLRKSYIKDVISLKRHLLLSIQNSTIW